jgi:hypothetical protein
LRSADRHVIDQLHSVIIDAEAARTVNVVYRTPDDQGR